MSDNHNLLILKRIFRNTWDLERNLRNVLRMFSQLVVKSTNITRLNNTAKYSLLNGLMHDEH